MKTQLAVFSAALIPLVFSGSSSPAFADGLARYVISSPDHPATFEVGANDKLAQDLKWDAREGRLLLKVVYAMDPSTDRWLPADQRTYTLHFPEVRCDESTRTLYVPSKTQGRVEVGSLHNGLAGPQVRLRDNVELIAHRENMHIDAKLVVH